MGTWLFSPAGPLGRLYYSSSAPANGDPLSATTTSCFQKLKLASVEEISFKSRDGTLINGFLVKPPDFHAGRKYPTLLRIHGGPVSQFSQEFRYDWQAFAAHGYVVVAANPRGSSGRGEAF